MFTYIVSQVLNIKTRYYSWRNKTMHISLDEVQFHANRLVWTSLPLSLAAGIGAIVLLNLCLCKWINKLANQDLNIAKRIFYLLSSSNILLNIVIQAALSNLSKSQAIMPQL